MSRFSLGRNKDATSPTFRTSNYVPPTLPALPFQTQTSPSSSGQPFTSSRRSSTRRRLTKTQRISSGSSVEPVPIVRSNTNRSISLGAISTSPLKMTFGADAQVPAGSSLGAASVGGAAAGAAAAATATRNTAPATPPRQQDYQQQRAFPLSSPRAPAAEPAAAPATVARLVEQYNAKRRGIVENEAAMAFDSECRANATEAELRANDVLLCLKQADQDDVFKTADVRSGYGNQKHAAFAGDHFLSNVALIEKTKVLRAARRAPKGAHLHIHYNASLKPQVLLELASKMERMFITSDLPLVFLHGDKTPDQNFYLCEIQFSILSVGREKPGDLFSLDYEARQTMPFRDFLWRFPADTIGKSAMDWLASKLVFSEEETYDIPQTASGAWERFNGRTRMMKGLFNYESVYRKYTELFLQNLLDDNIQYAEIRPNFMTTNQLWNDQGTAQVDNAGIVQLIVDACEAFLARNAAAVQAGAPGAKTNFDGIKIIYCTPRSFQNDKVRAALAECLAFKRKWPEYIAGFDLVGEESKGFPLRKFVPEFLQFQEDCDRAGVQIPFLFHCGETLDMGTDVDGNLVDALLLGAKRIGHGFALPRHPLVLDRMKRENVCVEVCPISNEILGLTPRIGGHAVYSLLAQNVPCTVNSDNGTLFQSSLSHDFYQVLVGKADMGLFGWRQLAEWSLVHACFSTPAAQNEARARWLDEWRDFVIWLLREYDADNPATQAMLAALAQNKSLAARPASK